MFVSQLLGSEFTDYWGGTFAKTNDYIGNGKEEDCFFLSYYIMWLLTIWLTLFQMHVLHFEFTEVFLLQGERSFSTVKRIIRDQQWAKRNSLTCPFYA